MAPKKKTKKLSEVLMRFEKTEMLQREVLGLRYVSSARSELLNKLGIFTVRDLFWHLPYRYIDFTNPISVADAQIGQKVTVVGTIDRVELKKLRSNFTVVEVFVDDGTQLLRLTFFQQQWLVSTFKRGERIAVRGTIEFSYGFKTMQSPAYELFSPKKPQKLKILPVYRACSGLGVAWIRKIVAHALVEYGEICDFIPPFLLEKRSLMARSNAFFSIHFPYSMHEQELARTRLAYEELFLLQVALLARKELYNRTSKAYAHHIDHEAIQAFKDALPFSLTSEQLCVLENILHDMSQNIPMNRLLLGDVGTGKTVVAALALLACVKAGYQGAIMAPTSVLASQHYTKLKPMFEKAGVRIELLLGSTPKPKRAEIYKGIAEGLVDIVIGTTALLNESITFKDLSLVVIDEQHRFGVSQRVCLRQKGIVPDLLSMSATPIPRTLALSLYGDMDISRIVHKPISKAKTITECVSLDNEDYALGVISTALAAGGQAYVVCSAIDEKDSQEQQDMQGVVVELDIDKEQTAPRKLMYATTVYNKYKKLFNAYTVALLHGRMTPAQKEEIMGGFTKGEIDILVSTTVIEVGVDVANANVMVVMDADRFGLATLHQLRGRVGRGSAQGHCLLVSPSKLNDVAKERLEALEKTDDGFELAQMDLKLRHEGDILGYRQHGGVHLCAVDLVRDEKLLEFAREDAKEVVAQDPYMNTALLRPLGNEVRYRFPAYFKETGVLCES